MSDENRTNEIYDAATEEEQREAERHKARKERAERMREEKRRSMMIRRYGTIGVVALVSLIVLITVVVKQKDKINPREIPSATEMASEQLQATETEQLMEEPWSFEAHETDQTADLPETVVSKHGILINADTGEILAERAYRSGFYDEGDDSIGCCGTYFGGSAG